MHIFAYTVEGRYPDNGLLQLEGRYPDNGLLQYMHIFAYTVEGRYPGTEIQTTARDKAT